MDDFTRNQNWITSGCPLCGWGLDYTPYDNLTEEEYYAVLDGSDYIEIDTPNINA